MYISFVRLKNWRNFSKAEVNLFDHTYLVGPNASGKSNFLDVFRFLHDICKPEGGGLQKALKDRGGISKVRCLHARQDPEVEIEIHFKENLDDDAPLWRYVLAFRNAGKGENRVLITKEEVWETQKNKSSVKRPNSDDNDDNEQLTQSYLEQVGKNKKFRDISEFFSDTAYLHLVPQLLKYTNIIGGKVIEDDPFGQGFLLRIAKKNKAVRDSRLKKIGRVLPMAVPQFAEIRFLQDVDTGRPHLEARYDHHRPNAGWQREEQFSDGTLRLIGLLWSLMEGNSLLLLEEPELSLNDGIVEEIPLMFQKIEKSLKRKRQIFISTHSEALLSNKGIDPRGILRLEPSKDGTQILPPSEEEMIPLSHGFSVAEVILPKTRPEKVNQLGFSF